MSQPAPSTQTRPSGLLRRLGAILYDSLLLFAVWMLAGALWLPFTAGDAVTAESLGYPLYLIYQLYLLLVAFIFFGGFWLVDGQTLGMRAWRLRLRSADGARINLRQALIRFGVAPLSWALLGLGFLYALFDRQNRTWHDLAAGTVIVVEPKR